MRIQQLFIFFVVALFLTACGSGGDSDGGIDDPSPRQAILSADNAQEVSMDAYFVGASGSFLGSSLAETPTPFLAETSILGLPQVIEAAIDANIDKANLSRAVVNVNESQSGPDGGSVTVSGAYDESSETFQGTFTFNDYQSDGTTVNGSMTVIIAGYLSTDNTMEVDFSSLTIQANGISSMTFDGSMTYQNVGTTQTITMDLVSTGSDVQYQIDDYTLVISSGQTDLSGVFYHSEYGYVTVTTTQPITTDFDGYPDAGTIEITGADLTKAVVTFSPGSAAIVADTDGDGELDDFSATVYF